MFLPIQDQFRDQMQTPTMAIDPVYAQAHAQWKEDNKNVLHTWDAETQIQSFSDRVQVDTENRLLAIIDSQNLDEETKKERVSLAKRGQLLLVSTDGGKTFDKYLTPEEIKTASALDYTLYSPTFRSSTTNLKEVLEEQTLLAVVKHVKEAYREENKLGQGTWNIENAYVENGTVHLEVTRSATSVDADEAKRFRIEVEVEQPARLPMVYERIDPNNEHRAVPETQLSNEFGLAKEDPTLQVPSLETVQTTITVEDDDAAKKAAVQAQVSAGLSTWAALEAIEHVSSDQRAAQQAEMARSMMERPLAQQMASAPVQNVMAAKAAMNARFARQNKVNEQAKQHEAERRAKMKEGEKFINRLVKVDDKAKKQSWSADQKALAKNSGIVAAAVASAATALAGSTMLVTHITLLS